ncbi:MAG: hypothetical protein IT236_01525 [Bacteroidia bacterium]|nr:hypothetical protein [Bacteroidia bacterium]
MKKLLFTSIILCLVTVAFAQVDTIYNKKNQKIPCKIVEINDSEIKYKMDNYLDGPTIVINKLLVIKYTLSNGQTEMVIPDEMLVENEHSDILKNRTVLKIHPFSFANNQVSVAYEKVIKVGMNLDVEAGYCNSSINEKSNLMGTNRAFYSGAYIKPGIKFFLGQDFSIKGLKYAHPLKGRYIKLDMAFSFLNYQNVNRYTSNYPNITLIQSDLNVMSYGGFVNYGRQFILGNMFTLEYYVGAGFTGLSYTYENSTIIPANNNVYNYNYQMVYLEGGNVSNFHGFLRIPSVGLSFTGGFRIGYIIPQKKSSHKPLAKTTAN